MAADSLFAKLCSTQTLLDAWALVKAKGSAGGVDGYTVKQFEQDAGSHIRVISEELRSDKWVPQPYLRVEIPKKEHEKRQLGLLTVKDKIVQQAILSLLQPRFDRLFVNNSYGYRPDKGPVKAVHRTASFCACKRYKYVLRLDIDNFFDTVDHTILFDRLRHHIPDLDVLRLVQLCVSMGTVSKRNSWKPSTLGLPQGALLSPLLSNFYLHPFDQFVLSKSDAYVRYADDFVVCCESNEVADDLLARITTFLDTRLHLKLNEPIIVETTQPFEFLGISICKLSLGLSDKKEKDILDRIAAYSLDEHGVLKTEHILSYAGIGNYYGRLLPQPLLEKIDGTLEEHLCKLVSDNDDIPNQKIIQQWLQKVNFLSADFKLNAKQHRQRIIAAYLSARNNRQAKQSAEKNKRLVNQRKVEYHRKESASSELIVNTLGSYIGSSEGKLVVRQKKEILSTSQVSSLRHVTVLAGGVSLSSNAIDLCISNKIPIDFFDSHGQHKATILSPRFTDTSCWKAQAMMSTEERFLLAQRILIGKVKNQASLVKYFNKYHSKAMPTLVDTGQLTIERLASLVKSIKDARPEDNYRETLMALEAQAAIVYWNYVRELVSDDGVDFEQRQHRGATDLFNSMLNYGYALLYARVWQALLAARLNPADSVLHVSQTGKPTFVYDVVELFRAQTVDRIVISMVQKHLSLAMDDKGFLTSDTRALLAKNILERMNRYEKYRGEEIRFEQIIHRQTQEIAESIVEHKTFKPYLAKW